MNNKHMKMNFLNANEMKIRTTFSTMIMVGLFSLALISTSGSAFAGNPPLADNPTSFGPEQIDLNDYIAQNVQYPTSLVESGYKVVVDITFWVDKFGNVINAEIITTRKIGSKTADITSEDLSLFQEAALEAVEEMPQVRPVVIDGVVRPRQYSLPIFFREQ
jgi:hypothetical protein